MPDLYNSLMERLGGSPYSGYFSCLCPFHEDNKPSFFVYEESSNKNWEFRCASCGKHGSLKYLDQFTGSHFVLKNSSSVVSKVLPMWKNCEMRYGSLEGIADAAHRSLKANSPFQTYFKRRKIYDFVDEGTLGYIDSWITFPVYSSEHRLVDIVVRSVQREADVRYVISPMDIRNRSLYVPSWKCVASHEIIYVVYGIIDAISLHLAGLPVVTGITGKSLSAELLKPFRKRFIIIPDDGEEKEAHRLANSLGWRARVKEISFPDGTKDADDIRRKFGNEYLLQALGA
jgi:DNA primase